MLTNELAKKVGVSAETVRFYTRKGLLTADRDPNNGYKIYPLEALNKLRFITQAKNIGFSLSQIEEIIARSKQGDTPCPKVREMLSEKIVETEQKIKEFQAHLALMQQTFLSWQHAPNTEPGAEEICCLIDSWSKTQA